jgi:hypothetical protein
MLYTTKYTKLLSNSIPLMFTDGTEVYKKLTEEYKVHKKGLFILAPSGAGKTYYINNQKEKNWIDGDVLSLETNAQPDGEWWFENFDIIDEIEQRIDIVTSIGKKLVYG